MACNIGPGQDHARFIQKEVKINAESYWKLILEDVVIPWAQGNARDIDWTFQQGCAPAHGAKNTLDRCETNLPDLCSKGVWPSNSPDPDSCGFRHLITSGAETLLFQVRFTGLAEKNSEEGTVRNFTRNDPAHPQEFWKEIGRLH